MRWGATDEEISDSYPGSDLIPEGERSPTMAVTIDATPAQVWPWLVQLGGDRGGWYSWDRLDNGGRPSATEVHPEWQDLAVGDYVKYWRRNGPVDAWRVAMLEPNRFLGLHALYGRRSTPLDPSLPRPKIYIEGLWGFLLTELPGKRTRLIISGYQAVRPAWMKRLVLDWLYVPLVWPMQARMMAVLKRNIERAATSLQPPIPIRSQPSTSSHSSLQ
jgi:proline iminopeptidase